MKSYRTLSRSGVLTLVHLLKFIALFYYLYLLGLSVVKEIFFTIDRALTVRKISLHSQCNHEMTNLNHHNEERICHGLKLIHLASSTESLHITQYLLMRH